MSKPKIRVGFFIDAYTPGAGTENQLRGILRHLDPNRVDAILVTLRNPIEGKHRAEIPWPVKCLNVGRLLSPVSVVRFFKLVAWLKQQKFDIAMIFFVDTNRFVVPACNLAEIRNIVINRRDMGYWYTQGQLFVLNRINKMADYFMVNATAVKDLVVEREKFPAEQVKVIYNGLWDWQPAVHSTLTKKSLGILEPASIVGIVASLRRVKRIDRFVEMAEIVLRAIPNTHFLVLGEGELESTLKADARARGLENAVHFLGQVDNVHAHLQLFEVGVLTSESEGLSNTLMEYAACGVPAVTFDTGGNREVVSDGKTGFLVPDGNVTAMAETVVTILRDKELRLQLSKQCTAHVAARFAPEVVISELMDFFEEITSKSAEFASRSGQ